MKIFIDTANIEQIKEVNSWGILDGVTTNPSLVAKENKDFATLVDEICQIVDGPISVEAISCKADEIVPEARKLAMIHKNIVVKIPMTEDGLQGHQGPGGRRHPGERDPGFQRQPGIAGGQGGGGVRLPVRGPSR